MNIYRTLPKKLRIGSYDFEVVVMRTTEPDNTRIYGDMTSTIQRIRVGPELTPQRLANTFIHEVLHAINRFMDVNDNSTEEECVTRGANGLCLFFQDNPEAGKWWVQVNALGLK